MLPYALLDKVKKKDLECKLEAGLAEKSNSPYASAIAIVPKKMSPFNCVSITDY